MIDFDALKVFVTVIEKGGFHAAAQAMFKSQPAITNAIKKLEEQIDIILFDRNYYRPKLTSQGEKLYQRAKTLITHWEHLNQFVELLQEDMETDITIAIDVFFPLTKLENLFRQWIARFPQTHFHFLSESLGGACERLLQGQADLIISENLISKQAVEVIPLAIVLMPAVATPQFIEQYKEELSNLDTLKDCMQVILKDSSKTNFSFGVIEQCKHWTVSDVMAKKEIILAGLGWGRLPKHLINNELNHGRLKILSGHHLDERLVPLEAIRLQKPAHGLIAKQLWSDLLDLKSNNVIP
ncbi:LysR family transcriptional regulator [Legionella gresilensis]|uniref:LysR family transcriptional regulator n=1 Tax=Legionella gresilensis TaxID=91823 RepID=UPI001F5E81F4|nr:LysR family transcriptional regulator [Legionella gresilensis]